MIKKIFFVFLLGCAVFAKTVSIDNVGEYIGDEVRVCGKVYSVYFAKNSKGQPTFLNIDGYYPNQKLTVVVWGIYKSRFSSLKNLKNKHICVKGYIEVYKNKFEIVLKNKNQLQIK